MSAAHHRRAAIIGAGLMGRWHADAVRRIGGTVTLIVDPEESARRALAARFPGASVAAELDASAVAKVASAAHVCTPIATHAPIVRALVDAGVHALVEKPLATDLVTTRELLAHAEHRAVIVCPVHQFLFQEGIRTLSGWLPAMGPIRRFEFSTCSAGGGDDPVGQDALIAEILPHPLSLMSHLLGGSLRDIGWQIAHPTPGEFRALGAAGPTIIDLAISAHGRPTENVLRIVADGGTATADLYHGFAVRHAPSVSRGAKIARPFSHSARHLLSAGLNLLVRTSRAEPAYPGLRELVRLFYGALVGTNAPPIGRVAIEQVAFARDALVSRMRSPSQ
jgi:predicted dehydrogenase